jgi:hypothetical protein
MTVVAVVESPFQALALQEAVAAGAIEPPDDVVVRGALGRGAPVLDVLDRGIREAVVTRSNRETFASMRRAEQLIVGDVFSTLAQLAVSARRRGRVVLLEDGASALRAWPTLAAGRRPLVRAHSRRAVSRGVATLATAHVRHLARRADVTVVTGLPLDDSVEQGLERRSFHVVRHGFAWSQAVDLAPDPVTSAVAGAPYVVLGSALAADGHVGRDFYEDWLRASFGGRSVFLPHRRDEPWSTELAARCGATVGRHVLPVELIVRDVDAELVVHSLPTTAVLTIPLVRGARPTVVHTAAPPRQAWSAHTPSAMVELVEQIAAVSRAAD